MPAISPPHDPAALIRGGSAGVLRVEALFAEKMAMTVTFVDDDRGFVRWRDAHRSGFVLSHEHKPRPNFLKVHRTTCPTLQGDAPARGNDWTRVLPKTCSDGIEELRQWARVASGGALDECPMCLVGTAGPGVVDDADDVDDVDDVDDEGYDANPADATAGPVAGDGQRLRLSLRNELGWMLRAAVRFEPGASDEMALQDSSLLHARKLVGFAASLATGTETRTERQLPSGSLAKFLDDWVLSIDPTTALAWPIDKDGLRIASHDPARLAKVIDLVFDFLEATVADLTSSAIGGSYGELVRRARGYWRERGSVSPG
jgi:hypothetical protein